ncbi:MAG: hypothetical protein PUC32_00610 [Oscillospiraceae bacterium]|nr:hypothetical protein [Oscillospiraceae bacterium]
MEIQQLSIFLENKTGRLSAVTKALGDGDINIRAMSASDTIDYGILRIIVDKPELALEKVRDAGFTASLTKVVAIGISDKPSALGQAMELLRDHHLSVEYLYAFTNQEHLAYVILRLDDNETGAKVLAQNGIRVIAQEELGTI